MTQGLIPAPTGIKPLLFVGVFGGIEMIQINLDWVPLAGDFEDACKGILAGLDPANPLFGEGIEFIQGIQALYANPHPQGWVVVVVED